MPNTEPASHHPGELHGFRDPAKKALWIGVAAVAVLLIGLFSARPLYREFKIKRAVQVVREATRLLDEQRPLEAGNRVKLALGLAPKHPEVLRAAARLCTQLGQIDGMTYWQMLAETGDFTHADRVGYARLALRGGRQDQGRVLVAQLLREAPNDPDTIQLVVEWMSMCPPKLAAQVALPLISEQTGNTAVEFPAASILLTHPEAAVRAEGRRYLMAVALGSSTNRSRAIHRLLQVPDLTRAELEVMRRSLLEIQKPILPEQLLRIDLSLRLDRDQRAALLAEATALAGPQASLEDRVTVGFWLLQQKEPQLALDWLPFDDAKRSRYLLQVHLQALADLGHWKEVEDVLAEPDLPMDPVMMYCFRGVTELRAGKKESAQANFDNALNACKGRLEALRLLASYTERMGAPESAIEAWRQVMADPAQARDAARQIARIAQKLPEMTASLSALRRLIEFQPDDPVVRQEYVYHNLILDTRETKASEMARQMFAEDSKSTDRRCLAALATWREGNAIAALELLEGGRIEWARVAPRWQALYAGVLGANDQRTTARQIARQINLRVLKPQEREFVKRWLPAPAEPEESARGAKKPR